MIKEFLNKAIVSGNRSTILLPLRWLIGLTFSATLISVLISAPNWIVVLFAVISVLAIILFLFTYIYSLVKQPDYLRSEKYTIQKMAIERGIFGDSIIGEIKVDPKEEEELKLIDQETIKIDSSEK